ncbi:carbohydrate phosphatase [Massarina eburnea CBS 473.64]|uniref:3'(2'),5'-bisphosphate nucleotidase n=1 Tax=Massarina eburnea CBS 473.64 TaxID=1395130 RepID=A0A6A6RNT3_9PLEO|nr:carbohydrate phosphatase [Massarina eburnea CBS 473.64]
MPVSTSPSYEAELQTALRIVHAASHLTKRVLRSLQNNVSAETKADDSPVTIADFAAQALIIAALHAVYPSDSFLGEESADQLRKNDGLAERVWELVVQAQSRQAGDDGLGDVQAGEGGTAAGHEHDSKLTFPKSKEEMLDIIDLGTGTQTAKGRVWVMDPVDGTATFMTGNQYAVCLCLLVDGVQKVGVIGCPNLSYSFSPSSNPPTRVHEDLVDTNGYGVVLSTIHGQGAYIRTILENSLGDPQRIQHSLNTAKESKELNFVETTMGKTSLSQAEHKDVADVLGAKWPGTVVWSQQMKYIALTLGATDVMLRLPKDKKRYTQVWDHAGGQLLFTEVGGVIRDIDGGDIDMAQGRTLTGERNFGMVAALPGVFDTVHKAVKDVLERRTR